MLDRLSELLDRLAGLSYWRLGLLLLVVALLGTGGYLILRPPSRPAGVFHAADGAAELTERQITVHVAGAVLRPGVVKLPEGSRVMDAVEGAGGPLPEADLDALNLAQVVQDGQKINVPRLGEEPGGGKEGGGKININTATRQELESLPGIGPTLAERIISYRERAGAFRSLDELKRISGIGERKFQEIKELVEI